MSYHAFFNLDEAPFRLTPDPEYYFPSKQHNEALDTLIYCVEAGEGFAQVTGEPGVGKTLLIRSFIDQLDDHVNTALILHPRLEAEELFKVILEDLGLVPENIQEMSKESLLRSFRDILLESANNGFQTIIIIDEAQEIPTGTLEELRLLSNLETDKKKLLQIILVGQRELEEKLNQPGLKQLHQRITIRYRLNTLTLDETINYIHHRLKIAGGGNITRFSPEIIKQIHTISNGIPRIINTLCERSLMAAFVDGKSSVNQKHLQNAVQSTEYNTNDNTVKNTNKKQAILLLLLAIILGFSALYFSNTAWRNLINQKTGQLFAMVQNNHDSSTSPQAESVDTPAAPQESSNHETATLSAIDTPGAYAPTGSKIEPSKTIIDAPSTPEPSPESEQGKIVLALAPRQQETPPSLSSAPSPVALPPGWRSLSIQQETGNVRLFLDKQPEAIKELTLPAGMTLEAGTYLLGQAKGKPFLFNHRSFFTWQMEESLADWLWLHFADHKSPSILPIFVSSTYPVQISDQTEQESIKTTIKKWAAAFEKQDINELMRYYDDSLLTYKLFRNRPTLTSHAEVTAKKSRIFEKTKAISLQISDPACIINSEDPSQGLAFFHQRFISSSYRDTGIKVLYLRKTDTTTSNQSTWVITGRLWLPVEEP